jgi:hypothetical protein
MRKNSLLSAISLPLLTGVICCCGFAAAQSLPAATDASPRLYPDTREIQWVFYVPVLTFEWREFVFQVVGPTVRSRRLDYEVPGLRTERLKLWQLPEFRCKYADWWQLPNECGVHWRDVYADAPVIVMQHSHVPYDAAEWGWQERRTRFVVPRWTWTERTLTVLMPVFTPEEPPPRVWAQAADVVAAQRSIDGALATLAAREADTNKVVEEAIAALDAGIVGLREEGAELERVSEPNGVPIDLGAVRQSLLDENARERARLARIREELDALAPRLNDATARPR